MQPWTRDEPLIWTRDRVPGSCRLTVLSGYDDDHVLVRGEPLASTWPHNVRYGMDPQAPQDMMLLDAVRALRPVVVASKRLADFLVASIPAGTLELLPITLVNHKKRPVADPYFIVNPLGLQDCLDIKKCGVKWSAISPDSITEMKRLVIEPSQIDAAVSMFRPRFYRKLIVVRRSLASAIDAGGFTGVTWTEPADFEPV